MPSYTFRSVGTTANASSTTATPGAPAGRTAGDLLLIRAVCRNNGFTPTIAAPNTAGWTLISPQSNDTCDALFARIADVTSTDLPTVQWSGTAQCLAQMCAFFGNVYASGLSTIVHASVDSQGTPASPNQNNIPYSALTITLANTLVIACGVHNKTATGNFSPTNGAVNSLAGFTQIDQLTPNGTVFSHWWGYQQQTTATNMSAVVQTRNSTSETLQAASLFISLKTASAASSANKGFLLHQLCNG